MSILLSSRSIYLFDKFYYHNYQEISFYLFNPIILFIQVILFIHTFYYIYKAILF